MTQLERHRYSLQTKLDLVRNVGLRHAWLRFRTDRDLRRAVRERAPRVAETMWRDAAEEIGAEVRALAPTLLEFRRDGTVTRIHGQATPFADRVSREVANDKPVAHRLLAEAGLPVAKHVIVDVRGARPDAVLEEVGAPCVVKPARGGGGGGVTGEVRTAAQLRQALTRAGKFHAQAIVEHQADGDAYRLLLLDGAPLDVLRRTRPRVTGDGRATIADLIRCEYARRLRDEGPAGLHQFNADLDCIFTLQSAGLRLDTVLPAGDSAVIKTATNYNGPHETERVTNPPPALLDPARRAAEVLGVRLAGVDIVTSDPTRALEETGGVLLEVNPVPGLTHHYNVAGSVNPVAVPILRALLGA